MMPSKILASGRAHNRARHPAHGNP